MNESVSDAAARVLHRLICQNANTPQSATQLTPIAMPTAYPALGWTWPFDEDEVGISDGGDRYEVRVTRTNDIESLEVEDREWDDAKSVGRACVDE